MGLFSSIKLKFSAPSSRQESYCDARESTELVVEEADENGEES